MERGSIFAVDLSRWLVGLIILVLALGSAPAARAEPQSFSLYDFQFEDGSVMPELRIAYETRGTLGPGRDNAIVLLHDTLGDRHGFDDMIGPGKVFDTTRFFVVTVDAIGGGESSSPGGGEKLVPGDGSGQDFPRYTIRDMMAADYALVSRGFGLVRLRAIVGRAMGADIALEWAIQHPEMPRGLVLLAPAPRSDANFQVVVDQLVSEIAFDPDWNGGHYERNPVEGLRHAGMIYYPWTVSAAYLDRISPAQLAQESEASAKSFASWDANSLVLRFAACRGHDVATSDGLDAAINRATMPVLLLPSASDRLVGLAGAQKLRAVLPHSVYAEIPGDLGHDAIAAPAGTPERDFIERAIRGFLKPDTPSVMR